MPCVQHQNSDEFFSASQMGESIQKIAVYLCLFYILIGLVMCSKTRLQDDRGKSEMPIRTLEEVLEEHTDEWMSIPGVVGTAQGLCDEKPCIRIFVTQLNSELEGKIPKTVQGYKVEIVETGMFRTIKKTIQ